MKKLLILIMAYCQLPIANCQTPPTWTSVDMYQAIRKLNVLGTVLYLAAHPDDDNSRLIAYLSKDRLYRTGYLSMTRGDGGQNLIGDEQGIELGLIRTQELLASRRIDGGEQFFTRAFDFGYSKSPEETFTKWDKEKILSDVVWVIRKFQPDVIITRFPTTGEGGHGHHTASAILANEAFTAAADPNRFPEQLKYVKPWQVKRVMWNTFNFGGANTTNSDQLHFDIGGYNPLLGKSYGEIGAESRSQNRTQGTGGASIRGPVVEYFRTTAGSAANDDLMDGVDVSWKRVKGGESIEKMVDDISKDFDFIHPERSVKALVKLYQALQQLPDGYWKEQKTKETKELIEQCGGLFIDPTTSDQYAVQTDSIRINFLFNNRLGVNASLKEVKMDMFDSSFNRELAKNQNVGFSKMFFIPPTKEITQPYWLQSKMAEGHYNVADQQKIGQADVDPAYVVNVVLNIEGQDISFTKAVKYKFTDPVHGELYEPVTVMPPALIAPGETIKISKGNNDFHGTLYVTAKKNGFHTSLKDVGREDPDDVTVKYTPDDLNFSEKNKTMSVDYSINAHKDNEYFFAVDAANGRKDVLHLGMREIKYDHIPYISYFSIATVTNKKLDLEIYGKKIGYIIGAGDKIPEILEEMGYEVNRLTEKEVSKNDLNKFDAIIAGVRAYNTVDWLTKYSDKINKYVEDGGNFIVQYNNTQFRGGQPKIGPYDFRIVNRRVTDENADVTFLKPDHPVMNFPNKITQDDFKGWIQERSIYHAANFDRTKFETIFSMHDPGEGNDDGSLIIGKYGKGVFVYTGLVFFRELPAGVPGAYRLLANIIALNRKKAF